MQAGLTRLVAQFNVLARGFGREAAITDATSTRELHILTRGVNGATCGNQPSRDCSEQDRRTRRDLEVKRPGTCRHQAEAQFVMARGWHNRTLISMTLSSVLCGIVASLFLLIRVLECLQSTLWTQLRNTRPRSKKKGAMPDARLRQGRFVNVTGTTSAALGIKHKVVARGHGRGYEGRRTVHGRNRIPQLQLAISWMLFETMPKGKDSCGLFPSTHSTYPWRKKCQDSLTRRVGMTACGPPHRIPNEAHLFVRAFLNIGRGATRLH